MDKVSRWMVGAVVRQSRVEFAQHLRGRGDLYLMRGVLIAAAAVPLMTLVRILPPRLLYLGELEWMEGGMLAHVQRVLAGQPLYGPPTVEFTPFIYPPLYPWLCAALAWLSAPSLFVMRLVSVLTTLGSMAVIIDIAWRRHRSGLAGLIGAGLFAATFRLGGAWFDVARVDSLFVFLLLLAVHAFLHFESRTSAFVAAVALAGACLAKQSGALSAVVLGLYALVYRDRLRLSSLAVAGILVAAICLPLAWRSGGWFYYYLAHLPRSHPLEIDLIGDFFKRDMFGPLAGMSLLSTYAIASTAYHPKGNGRRGDLLTALLALILPAWFARFHSGNFDNVLMPMHVALAIGVAEAVALAHTNRSLLATVVIGYVSTLWLLHFDASVQVPSALQQRRLAAARAVVAKLPPRTWMVAYQGLGDPRHGVYGAHGMALLDVVRDNQDLVSISVHRRVTQAIHQREFDAIVLPGRTKELSWINDLVASDYSFSHGIDGPDMLTGWNIHWLEVWTPNAANTKDTSL